MEKNVLNIYLPCLHNIPILTHNILLCSFRFSSKPIDNTYNNLLIYKTQEDGKNGQKLISLFIHALVHLTELN